MELASQPEKLKNMNTEYWKSFYEKKRLRTPSAFAKFVLDIFKTNHCQTVLDIGCGNGRDSEFFFRKGFLCVGIDKYVKENKKVKFRKVGRDKIVICYLEKDIKDLRNFKFHFDIAYCRFLFHAIDEKLENIVLDWSSKNAKVICAEYRNVFDRSNRVFKNHERRLINDFRFQKKLITRGFRIIYFIQGQGMAKFKSEDPNVSRIIAIKEG